MYVCGPTVYKPSHIGHMVGPVIFDTVKRYLTYLGYQVTLVVNITDVDDKLIVRARELGTTVKELAERMTADYLDCLKKLNVTGIDHMPRATEHIAEMIEIMQGPDRQGLRLPGRRRRLFRHHARTTTTASCATATRSRLEAGARIEVSDKKRNPGDFALWKGAKPGEPAWDSPWGPGRPGWHIECSAMSMKLLGKTLDIHGGGLDLQFPHHENELAQSESYTGQPFARYWMHNGLLKMGTAKMAGSVGNVVNVVGSAASSTSPETVRFLLLSTHYRSPIEYSDDRLRGGAPQPGRLLSLLRALPAHHRRQLLRPAGADAAAGQPPAVGPSSSTRSPRCASASWSAWTTTSTPAGRSASVRAADDAQSLRRHAQLEDGTGRRRRARRFPRRACVVLRELSQILGLFGEPPQQKQRRRRRQAG